MLLSDTHHHHRLPVVLKAWSRAENIVRGHHEKWMDLKACTATSGSEQSLILPTRGHAVLRSLQDLAQDPSSSHQPPPTVPSWVYKNMMAMPCTDGVSPCYEVQTGRDERSADSGSASQPHVQVLQCHRECFGFADLRMLMMNITISLNNAA